MAKIEIGTKVPDFSLPATDAETFTLKGAAGKALVIYFYPKDMTSGCTRESQDFRDLHAAFAKAGARIVEQLAHPLVRIGQQRKGQLLLALELLV